MKRITAIIIFIALSLSFLGCQQKEEGGISDGSQYFSKSCKIKIIPPQGWTILEKKMFFGPSLILYSPKEGQARIRIVVTRLGIISWIASMGSDLPSKSFIEGCKTGVTKVVMGDGVKGKLLKEGKTSFNGKPAYEMNFTHRGKTNNWLSKMFLLKLQGKYYEVSYYVAEDENHQNNNQLISSCLKALEFVEN